MNLRQLAEDLGLEEDEFMELAELFIETGLSDLDNLRYAALEGNATVAASAAHSLKGAASNLGFMEIHDAAKKIEKNLRNNRLEGAPESAQALKMKLHLLAKLIQA
jgi:HPt (histidine-containing phosphotransfer) domain-containing protein